MKKRAAARKTRIKIMSVRLPGPPPELYTEDDWSEPVLVFIGFSAVLGLLAFLLQHYWPH